MNFKASSAGRARRIGAVLLLLGGLGVPGVRAEDQAAPARGGMRAEIDPRTGNFARQPVVPLAPTPGMSRSPVGLVETPAPGGGVSVDLQGRFRSAMVSTVGPDGTVHTGCRSGSAGTDESR